MCIDIGIDSDRNAGLDAIAVSHLVDDIYLLKGLAVECLDTESQRVIDLLICLADSCIYDSVCGKTA